MAAAKKPQAAPSAARKAAAPRRLFRCTASTASRLAYAVGFLLLFAFFYFVYGDVMLRAGQQSYVSTSTDTLYYVLSRPFGSLYVVGRFLLLPSKWPWLFGLLMAVVMAVQARLADYVLSLPKSWRGVGFIVPAMQMGWMVWRGTNLYYKNEPGLITLIPVAALLLLLLLAALKWGLAKWLRRPSSAVVQHVRPWGLLAAVVLVCAPSVWALAENENVILTARLQNLCDEREWDTIIEEARAARRPSRAVAAYHAIALLETNQLVDGLFDIAYDYPKLRLDSLDGAEEYGLFLADCNLHAGLLNPAYRASMDQVVMHGPRVDHFKRMALCALLSGEDALCRKYIHLVGRMPFEGEWVDYMTACLRNRKLIADDDMMAHILSLKPQEQRFEQSYRYPAFLGYNIGLAQGADATLHTSVAACLYSKDLQAAAYRIAIMAQKGMPMSAPLQQCVAILRLNHPEMADQLPPVPAYVEEQYKLFLTDAKPYVKDRLGLRRALKEAWLGTFFYYYYAENNDPDQVLKRETGSEAGVN